MKITGLFQRKEEPADAIFSNADLKKLIWPLVAEQVLVMFVGLCDTVMVSKVGEAAVSGVSLVDMINQLIIAVLSALATGGAVIASQYLGHREKKKACQTANQLLLVVTVISLVIMVIALAFKYPILRTVFGKVDVQVMENALVYFAISAASYPFLAMYNAGGALFRSMGNSKITLKVSLLMNVINIVFNAIFIFGMGMGAAGAALGSLIARAVSAIVINMLLRNEKQDVHFIKWGRPLLDIPTVKKILYIGIPSGIENGLFQLGRILVVAIIAKFGTTQIAANAVANNFDGLGVIPGNAMMLAMITVIGQCVGAGNYKQAEHYAKKLMKLTYAAFFLWDGILLLTLDFTMKLYSLSDATMVLSKQLIFIHDGFAILIWPLAFVLPNALRAANDVKFTMVTSIFSMIVFRIIFSLILGQNLGWGAIGVWVAMIIDWVFRSFLFVWRFLSKKWQRYRLIE